MECYVLTLIPTKYHSFYKEIEVETNREKQTWYWYSSVRNYDGWVICGNKPDIKYPADDTWDGWCPIYNDISFLLPIDITKIRNVPFDTLEELEDYVTNILPKIVKEETFKW